MDDPRDVPPLVPGTPCDELAAALDAMPPAERENIGLLDDPEAPGSEPDRYCATILAFYETILARPDAEVGPLMRALLGPLP